MHLSGKTGVRSSQSVIAPRETFFRASKFSKDFGLVRVGVTPGGLEPAASCPETLVSKRLVMPGARPSLDKVLPWPREIGTRPDLGRVGFGSPGTAADRDGSAGRIRPGRRRSGGREPRGAGGLWRGVPAAPSSPGFLAIVSQFPTRFEASYEPSVAEAFGNLPSSPAYLSPAFLKAEPSSMNFRC